MYFDITVLKLDYLVAVSRKTDISMHGIYSSVLKKGLKIQTCSQYILSIQVKTDKTV